MSTLRRSRLETNVSSEATCCTASSLLWSVARKCCSSQVPLCQVTCRLVSVSRSVPPNTAQTERVLTRLVVTPPLRLAVCITPKECCICHPCIECVASCVVLPVLHAQLYDTSARVTSRRTKKKSHATSSWSRFQRGKQWESSIIPEKPGKQEAESASALLPPRTPHDMNCTK